MRTIYYASSTRVSFLYYVVCIQNPIVFAPTNSHLRVSSSREGAIWGCCSWLIDTTSGDERIQYCFRLPFGYCVHSVK